MSTLDKIEEIKIITPNISEEDRGLITRSVNNIRIYGGERNNLAKYLLNLSLLEARDELSDLKVMVGIPESDEVEYLSENLQGGIEKDEIVGKIKTYDGRNCMGSLIVFRNKKSKKEDIYLSIKY
jgi:hypothetical protein